MIEKLKFLVTEICRDRKIESALKIIENSEFSFEERKGHYTYESDKYELIFDLDPNIYIKFVDKISDLSDIIKFYFEKVSDSLNIEIQRVIIKPDYNKINVLSPKISIVKTPWKEVNDLQNEIINSMKTAQTTLDFQNIGNSARTIMDKISRIVFNPEIHKAPKQVKVNNGNFKNQLHTFIKSNLEGEKNKELRRFSISAIDFTENSIDLMNQTTHKLDVQKHFAEVCVISTINIVSLLKAISEL